MRLNVYVPDELAESVRRYLPELNVSKVLQTGLQSALHCDHEQLVCAACATPVDHRALAGQILDAFYLDYLDALYPLVKRGATAEGAARVAKEVAERHRVPCAAKFPLPRPTRSDRVRQRVLEFPDEPRPRSVPQPAIKPRRETA